MKGKGSVLAQKCLQEVRERAIRGGGISDWERERVQFFEERDLGIQEWERRWEKGVLSFEDLEERDKERQREERSERIKRSRCNRWYELVKTEEIPAYLGKG